MKRALITGAAGQDGSYLAELLLTSGYEVSGIVRGAGPYPNLAEIEHRVQLFRTDLLDQASLIQLLRDVKPAEVYNLASLTFVPASWEEPVRTAEFGAVGVTALLEAIRTVDKGIRFCQASSSEIFGEPLETPQTEQTPVSPLTPYGIAKTYGHLITRSYRRHHQLHASSAILYNHESPRRPERFLPSKLARAAARIAHGIEKEVTVGDLEARRDWGYAVDYVRAIWLMVQQAEAGEYVICSGESHSVGELAEIAFGHVGLDWREHVRSDPALGRRSAELHHLAGDPKHAEVALGWRREVDFKGLIGLLVDAELERIDRH
jgi:GDPmannose 4,6-dehydratase